MRSNQFFRLPFESWSFFCLLCSIIYSTRWITTNAEGFTGDGTAYTLGTPSAGNCNFMTWPDAAVHNYAAINDKQWNSSQTCGRCALVSCADTSKCTSTASEVVYIMDRCPECKYGDLDLSPTVFQKITGSGPSRLPIKWKFIDCPVNGNLQICLKSGSNNYWTAIQPANSITGIQRVTINGENTDMVPSAYYFKVENSNGIDLNNVEIAIESNSGEVLQQTISLQAGQCVTGTKQFRDNSSKESSILSSPTSEAVAVAFNSQDNQQNHTSSSFASNGVLQIGIVGAVVILATVLVVAYRVKKRRINDKGNTCFTSNTLALAHKSMSTPADTRKASIAIL